MGMQGLNWANRARNRGESVRPDLWPDHAWVPALGCQGGVLYDLGGANHGTLVNTPSWLTKNGVGLDFDGGNGADKDRVDFAYVTLPATGWTILFSCDMTAASTIANAVSGTSGNNVLLQNASKLRVSASGTIVDFTGLKEHRSKRIYTAACNGATLYIYYDGVLVDSAALSGKAFIASQIGGTPEVYNYNMDGIIYCLYLYKTYKTGAEVSDLSPNPLLPFRCRTIQKYWVPSGGGTTFNAAWARNSNVIIQPGVY